MSAAARSILIYSIYLFGLGAALLVVPNIPIRLFGLAETTEVWVRILGMTVVFSGRAGRHDPSAPATVSLDELLVTSDVVSIHAPGTPETRHLIDKRTLARMKRSAILVNTARGSSVDEEALAWALGERLIAGAALDVYEREPAIHPGLKDHQNVLLAPHLGSATRETRTAMADLAVRNVLSVLDGQGPLTAVHPPSAPC